MREQNIINKNKDGNHLELVSTIGIKWFEGVDTVAEECKVGF